MTSIQQENEFDLRSASTDEARLDVKAKGFYRQGQCAFFDIRIANWNAVSNKSQATEKILLRHENEKKRAYNRRIIEIEQSIYTSSFWHKWSNGKRVCDIS